MKTFPSHQNGNALFMILIAIVVFATLTYTVSNMLQSGVSGNVVGEEKVKLMAGEVLDYARNIRQSVQDMRITHGCADAEVSFENPVVAGYNFATRAECQVFLSGASSYQKPPLDWLDTTQSARADYETLVFSGENIVPGIGDDTQDELIMFIPYLRRSLCSKINETLNLAAENAAPPQDASDVVFAKFAGAYGAQEPIDTTPTLNNKMSGCFEGDDNPATGTYHFYQVLIVR